MSLATLLDYTSPLREEAFSFEHSQSHRRLLGSMSPLDRFSVIPYLLSPGTNTGLWHEDHQQAHNDFIAVFPGWFGETVGIIGPGYNIQDMDLDNARERTWWTFQNHYAHLDAENIQNPTTWVWPFW